MSDLDEARALLEWIRDNGTAFSSAIEIAPYGERTDNTDGVEWMARVKAFLASPSTKGTPE